MEDDEFCWPCVGIVVNIDDDKSLNLLSLKYKKLAIEVFDDEVEGKPSKAIVCFGREEDGFEKAVEFQRLFYRCKKSKNEWIENKDNGAIGIYGWLCHKKDYDWVEGKIGEYLRKITTEEGRKAGKVQQLVRLNQVQQEEEENEELTDDELIEALSMLFMRDGYGINLAFSWREPHRYPDKIGNRDWKSGETPLPQPVDQKKTETCIPSSIKVMMEAQMNLMARGTNQKVPTISLAQLKDVFSELKIKTLEQMLIWVSKTGVVAEDDYVKKKGGKKTGTVRRGARRYKIRYEAGYDPESSTFFADVSKAIARGEILIGEFLIKSDYDYSGKDTLYKGYGTVELCEEGEDEEGHAVLLTGYGKTQDGNTTMSVFEYLNSYGRNWGRDEGFADITSDSMHFVYNTKVIKWF